MEARDPAFAERVGELNRRAVNLGGEINDGWWLQPVAGPPPAALGESYVNGPRDRRDDRWPQNREGAPRADPDKRCSGPVIDLCDIRDRRGGTEVGPWCATT